MFIHGVTPFAKMISGLIAEGKEELLMKLLNILPCASEFSEHVEETHEENGIRFGDSDATVNSLKSSGGSINDLLDFIGAAKNSAQNVNQPSLKSFFKKTTDNSSKNPKKSRMESVDEREKRELAIEGGLEKEYVKSFVGLANIPLDNIEISPDLVETLIANKVLAIKDNMLKRYDPSISIPVVHPLGEDFDPQKIDEGKYGVVQKIHTVKAFQELDEEGKFASLVSHENKTVPCYVLNISSSGRCINIFCYFLFT